jgi:hypothetical protein
MCLYVSLSNVNNVFYGEASATWDDLVPVKATVRTSPGSVGEPLPWQFRQGFFSYTSGSGFKSWWALKESWSVVHAPKCRWLWIRFVTNVKQLTLYPLGYLEEGYTKLNVTGNRTGSNQSRTSSSSIVNQFHTMRFASPNQSESHREPPVWTGSLPNRSLHCLVLKNLNLWNCLRGELNISN